MILEMGTNRSINQYANSNSIEVASAVSTTTKAVGTREEDSNKMIIVILLITIRGVPEGKIGTTGTTVETRMKMGEMEHLPIKMRDNSNRRQHIATNELLQ